MATDQITIFRASSLVRPSLFILDLLLEDVVFVHNIDYSSSKPSYYLKYQFEDRGIRKLHLEYVFFVWFINTVVVVVVAG